MYGCSVAAAKLELDSFMSARDASKKTGGVSASGGNRPVAGMTPVHFAFFAVGVRITQLLMLHVLAEHNVSRQSLLVSENIMIGQAYSFLATAFERLAQALGLNPSLTERGREIIAEGSNAWKTCTKEDADSLGNTVLCMGEFRSLIRDLSASLGAAGAKARDWFELGFMVPEGEGDDSLPYEDRVWKWNNAERVDRQLKLLDLRREDVFPEPIDRSLIDGWMILPGRFSGWNNIEAGLMNLANMVTPDQSATEDAILQLTVPELATFLFGPKIIETGKASAERLNRKWIEEGRIPARRLKRGLYSIRTSHLELLKDIHR
jgi:hypothetical protein